jgi:hypothetical protein
MELDRGRMRAKGLESIEHRKIYCESRSPQISGLKKAILFISADWAIQSKNQLANLSQALRELDSKASDVVLSIADTDQVDYDYINKLLDEKCSCPSSNRNHLGGNGEIVFVRDDRVVGAVAHRPASVEELGQLILKLLGDL